ncbi:Dabb family protein [Spirosoma linguale]|uniref:Stress responsive alpha-beta barrel domain protein n=1 Tax=Spirosoma linguale (strain ATCC 33905 / DSM 74 / LMG 10896 / Claus 1) TaxID=504472 RepID=D2QQG6_SPILD|nr:Stress responsive alpha-beta barrel domain protein [Spirosoma linguale DSM 74]
MKSLLTIVLLSLLSITTYAHTLTSEPPVKKMKSTSVQHIVLFKFKPETTPAKVKEIVAAFEALPSQIKEIKGFKWGTNNSPENLNKGLTHAFILTFDNEKDRDAYLPHPAHKAFGGIVGAWLADVTVVDFTDQAK